MALSVLIVDDSPAMRAVVRRMLQISGLDLGEVYFARHGAEALASLARDSVDLVISDVNMHGLDGEALLRCLARNPDFCHIPVLMISSDHTHDKATRVMALGARGFIAKPFSPETLRSEVARILELPDD